MKIIGKALLCLATAAIAVTFMPACNDGLKVPKSDKVTEEEWIAAFDKTAAAENFTFEAKDETVWGIEKTELSEVFKADLINNRTYYKADGKNAVREDITEIKEREYVAAENLNVMSVEYNSGKWRVNNELFESAEEVKKEVADTVRCFTPLEYTELSFGWAGEAVYTRDGYSQFEYSGGMYKATVENEYGKGSVGVSIKDGYVVGVTTEVKVDDPDEYRRVTSKRTYIYKDFGTTEVVQDAEIEAAINAEKYSVAGKTFEFFKFDYEFFSAQAEEDLGGECESIEREYAGKQIIFGKNNTVTYEGKNYRYTQNGNEIKVPGLYEGATFIVDGDTVSLTELVPVHYRFTYIYKLVENA